MNQKEFNERLEKEFNELLKELFGDVTITARVLSGSDFDIDKQEEKEEKEEKGDLDKDTIDSFSHLLNVLKKKGYDVDEQELINSYKEELKKTEEEKKNFYKHFIVINNETDKKNILNSLSKKCIKVVDCIIPCVYGIDEEAQAFSASLEIKDTLLRNGYKQIQIAE